MVDYPGEHQHAGKRGDQDKHFGVGYLHKTFAQMQANTPSSMVGTPCWRGPGSAARSFAG
jgi:hypothetical protein